MVVTLYILLSHATFRLTPDGPKPRLTSSRATHPSSWQQPHLGDEEQSRQRNLDPLQTTYATTQNELVDLDLQEILLYNDQ